MRETLRCMLEYTGVAAAAFLALVAGWLAAKELNASIEETEAKVSETNYRDTFGKFL